MDFTYRGLSAQLKRHIITEEEVERQLQRLLQQSPRIAVINDRPTENGDEVVLDYAGFCDGEQFAGGTAQKQTLVLGSGMFIPGFEEQLLDKVPGEKVVVNVTFPTEYHAPNLAGKEAQFHCTIHEIHVKTAYELDDVFAKEVGQCDTLEEMRGKLKEGLQAYSDQQGEMDLQDRLIRQAASSLEIQVSDEMKQNAAQEQLNTLKAQLAQQGLSLEMYCSFMGTDENTLLQDYLTEAQEQLKIQAAVELIADLEQLEATQEEIGQALAVIARQNNMTPEQIQEYYNAEFEQAVIKSVLTSKVLQLVRDAANVAVTE